MELVAQLHEPGGGDLLGNDHNRHDEGEGGFFQPEVVGVQSIGCQGGEVGGQQGGAGGHKEAVEHTPGDIDGGVVPGVFQIGQEIALGQELETALEVGVGAAGVDNKHIEGEQAQHSEENQDGVDHPAADGQRKAGLTALVQVFICHVVLLLTRPVAWSGI